MSDIIIKINNEAGKINLNRLRIQIVKSLIQQGVPVIMSYTNMCHNDIEAGQVDNGPIDMTTPNTSA